MSRYGFATKREAVNYALRALRVKPLTRDEILELEGIGWEGDLDAMRSGSVPDAAAS
jgi:Arc/MetJ family transcription regulator